MRPTPNKTALGMAIAIALLTSSASSQSADTPVSWRQETNSQTGRKLEGVIRVFVRKAGNDTALKSLLEKHRITLQYSVTDLGVTTGAGLLERLLFDLKTGTSRLVSGMYYLRVVSADAGLFGPGSEYAVRIFVPIGGAGGVPFPPGLPDPGQLLPVGAFYVYLGPPQAVAAGAGWRLQQMTNQTYLSDSSGVYALPASPNWLSFHEIPGFVAPTNRSLVISADRTRSVMAYYVYTNASPRAENPVIGTNGILHLTFLATAGKRYALEQSTNLFDWVALVTNQVPQDGLLRWNQTNASAEARSFYRARLVR